MLLSSEMYRLLGHHKSQKMSWDKFLKYIVKEDRNYFEQVITNALKKGATFSIEYQLKRGDSRIVNIKTNGKVRKKSSGEVRIMAVSMDITEQNESQKTIERLAYYDALTNLPNRTLFKDRLQESIALARREAHSVAILFIDLDRFKLINDSLGHSVGDQLLAEVALRLNSQLREVDTLARVGGDEFIIILPHIKGAEDAMLVAKKTA
jgi:PAS domain S-box-containing protein